MRYKIFVFIREGRKIIQRADSPEAFTVDPLAVVDAEDVFRVSFNNDFASPEAAMDWIRDNRPLIADYRLTVLPMIIP